MNPAATGARPGARITFLGDTLVGGEGQAVLDERGLGWAFDGIRHLLAPSNLVVVNQEGPITGRTRPGAKLDTGRKRYWYRGVPESVEVLVDVGVRVASLANNHVLDFGPEGLADTIQALDDAGIAHCGAGPNRAAARRPAIVEVNGLRLGFLSFMQRYDVYIAEGVYASGSRPGPLRLSVERARRDLAKLEDRVDLRVALAHWGRNYRKRNPRQQRLAGALRAAGADLVIGHHPHVPHRIEVTDGVPVCFSLGNGPLGTPGRFHSGRLPYGLVVSFDLDARARPRQMTVELIFVDNATVQFRPRVADGPEDRRVLRRLLPKELEWRESEGGGLTAALDTPVVRPSGEPAHT